MKSLSLATSALRRSAEPEAETRNQRRQRQGAHALYPSAATVAHGRALNRTRSSSLQHAIRCTKLRAARPNPSLKRSANGRPPGPVWRYAVHFRQPGPGVLPLSTA